VSTPRPDDEADVPRDAWLRAALRHAPDADAAPPPALSEAILREARRSTATHGRPIGSLGGRLLAAWSWLARPPVAAAFASLMVATVVGVMWWDRPLEQALPPREAPGVAPAPPAATTLAVPADAPKASADSAPIAAAPTPPPPTPGAVPRGEAARKAMDEAAPRAPRAAPPAVSRERERHAAPMTGAEGRAAPPVADAATMPSTPAVPPALTAGTSPDANRTAEAESPAPATAPATAPARAPAAAPPAASPRAVGAARRETVAPLGALRASVAMQPERWTWQRDGGAPMATNTALMQWLQRVGETARGRWQVRPGRTETAAAPATTVHLLRDGRVHTALRLGPDGLEVDAADGARLRAALPGAEATALRIELDQATR
jgi:hypothetical protein